MLQHIWRSNFIPTFNFIYYQLKLILQPKLTKYGGKHRVTLIHGGEYVIKISVFIK